MCCSLNMSGLIESCECHVFSSLGVIKSLKKYSSLLSKIIAIKLPMFTVKDLQSERRTCGVNSESCHSTHDAKDECASENQVACLTEDGTGCVNLEGKQECI